MARVERVLLEHPAVVAACVVGIPEGVRGERIKTFVAPEDAAAVGTALEQELIAHCREHLIRWSCPREVEFRSELPLTMLGKIDYRALTEI